MSRFCESSFVSPLLSSQLLPPGLERYGGRAEQKAAFPPRHGQFHSKSNAVVLRKMKNITILNFLSFHGRRPELGNKLGFAIAQS